jgi:hypothetical protein
MERERVIALLEARRAGLLARSHWLRNVVAGVVPRLRSTT